MTRCEAEDELADAKAWLSKCAFDMSLAKSAVAAAEWAVKRAEEAAMWRDGWPVIESTFTA